MKSSDDQKLDSDVHHPILQLKKKKKKKKQKKKNIQYCKDYGFVTSCPLHVFGII